MKMMKIIIMKIKMKMKMKIIQKIMKMKYGKKINFKI